MDMALPETKRAICHLNYHFNKQNMSEEQTEKQKALGLPENLFWTAEGIMASALIGFVFANFNGNFDAFLGEIANGVRTGKIDAKEGAKIAQVANSARFYFSVNCAEAEEQSEATEEKAD